MNRHRAYYPLDDAPVADGDSVFTGVNMRLAPSQLQDGELAEAVNCRFTNGVPEPRKGNRILPWGLLGEPGATTSSPYGTVRTAGAFRDPTTGHEWLVVATAAGTYAGAPGNTGTLIPQPPNLVIPEGARLIQTYNGLVMLRGAGLDPVYMTDLIIGWRYLPEVTDPDLEALPPATQGVYWQNRLMVVDARATMQRADSIWVSDYGATSSVLRGLETGYQNFKVNQGSADRLVAVYPFNSTTLICAKDRSVYVVQDCYGDNQALEANARLEMVTGEWGCRAAESIVQVGADLWMLAHRRGIVSIRATEQNLLQGVDLPVSRDIQPLIDRINWDAADGACAVNHDNTVRFAVPLDGATTNNAVLVYDLLTQKWAGYDTGDALQVKTWVKLRINGAQRLGYLSPDGYVYLADDGMWDDIGDGETGIAVAPIAWRWRTRAYGARTPGRKIFSEVRLNTETYAPNYRVRAYPDGANESVEVAHVVKDRTRWYRPWNRAAYDPTNANDDFNEPYRQDYSVAVGTGGLEPGAAGITFGKLQATEESWRVNLRGETCQLEVAGTGRVVARTVKLDTRRGTTRQGPKS